MQNYEVNSQVAMGIASEYSLNTASLPVSFMCPITQVVLLLDMNWFFGQWDRRTFDWHWWLLLQKNMKLDRNISAREPKKRAANRNRTVLLTNSKEK